jgi:hypothetical protein
MGFEGLSLSDVVETVSAIAEKFRRDVESFYDPETIARGHIDSRDRSGHLVQYPLMTVSAVVLDLPEESERTCSADDVAHAIAQLKKEAKNLPGRIRVARVSFSKGNCPAPGASPERPAAIPLERLPWRTSIAPGGSIRAGVRPGPAETMDGAAPFQRAETRAMRQDAPHACA